VVVGQPPLAVVTWIATTELETAAATFSQFGLSDVDPDTGAVSVFDCPIVESDDGDAVPLLSLNPPVRPTVATLAIRAAAAAAPITLTHRRCGRTRVGAVTGAVSVAEGAGYAFISAKGSLFGATGWLGAG